MRLIRRITTATFMCLFLLFIFFLAKTRVYAYATIGAKIPVSCIDVSSDDMYIYEIKIESESEDSPEPTHDILKIMENSTGYFEINITEPGTFNYRIYEVEGNDTSVKYDRNIYSINVFVENSTEDNLTYAIVAKIIGRDNKPENIEFQNVMIAHEDPSAVDATIKTNSPFETSSLGVHTTMPTNTIITPEEDTNSETEISAIGFIVSILTGDRFPTNTVRAMFFSFLMLIFMFHFKQNRKKDKDK